MSDSNNNNASNNSSQSLLAQVEAEIQKAGRESLKAKVKALVQKRIEAEKVVNGINLEIQKAIEDFENGV